MTDWLNRCHFGDVREVLRRMAADGLKVNTIVTSPPYWGLRSYLPADDPLKALEIGSEPTLQEFLSTLVDVFSLAREVLRDDGTMWINMGDSYCTDHVPAASFRRDRQAVHPRKRERSGLKDKDLMGQPWRLAFALQDAGWWLRSDIIWSKPNPMPESAKDRPTKSHEYMFLLAKSETYYFDFDAFQEPTTGNAHPRMRAGPDARSASASAFPSEVLRDPQTRRRKPVAGWADGAGVPHSAVSHNQVGDWSEAAAVAGRGRVKTIGVPYVATPKARAGGTGVGFGRGYDASPKPRVKNNENFDAAMRGDAGPMRNRRTVWEIPTQAYSGAHFATYPERLVEPCILAGCPVGGTVLDLFFGSGTTGKVGQRLQRNYIGIDLDARNAPLQAHRLGQRALELEAA